ncbi:MAG TPA: hypothetical protein VKZ18_14920 [Polyangia bacterium]|nr:hypothetical protein [Polyangia bacterium]
MTKPTMTRLLPLTAALALAVGCAAQPPPAAATAQAAPGAPAQTATAPGLRSPDAILADAIAATGGAAAWAAHQTIHAKLTMSFAGMAMSGPADHYQTRADKSLTVTNFPGIGIIKEGSNGQQPWSKDPINGLRLLDGAEAEQARIENAWNVEIEARSLFTKIETVPDAPAGLECLTLTLRAGAPMRDCYDRQTHLQVSLEGTRATPQGDVPFKSTISDWRSVGGIKVPFSSETHAGPVTIVNTVDDVRFDEPVDDKMFDPPAAGGP